MEDYGRRDWELPCVCRHLKKEHEFRWYKVLKGTNGEDSYCQECFNTRYFKPVHKFKLDNLAYVEQVARAKGLV
jgi:hypothetical protein